MTTTIMVTTTIYTQSNLGPIITKSVNKKIVRKNIVFKLLNLHKIYMYIQGY